MQIFIKAIWLLSNLKSSWSELYSDAFFFFFGLNSSFAANSQGKVLSHLFKVLNPFLEIHKDLASIIKKKCGLTKNGKELRIESADLMLF